MTLAFDDTGQFLPFRTGPKIDLFNNSFLNDLGYTQYFIMDFQSYHMLSPQEHPLKPKLTVTSPNLSNCVFSHSTTEEPVTSHQAIKTRTGQGKRRFIASRAIVTQCWTHWKLELAASFIILAVPLAIVGTLYPCAGQPMPQWPVLISLNALLSIYSVAFRACLTFILASCIGQLQWTWFSSKRTLYDVVRYNNAANGRWGSLQLLWTQRMRQPLTAFGALILILSVAIDPFIQQLLLPTDCNIKITDQKATIPRSNILDSSIATYAESSVMTPVYTPETFLSWQCPSGNCTFSQIYNT